MDQMDLLEHAEAVANRNAVLDEVASSNAGWLQRAAEEMRRVPLGHRGLAEDFRKALLDQGLAPPRSPNAWGPLTAYLVREGMLKPTGEWKPMRSERSNGRLSREYVRSEPEAA